MNDLEEMYSHQVDPTEWYDLVTVGRVGSDVRIMPNDGRLPVKMGRD